MGMYINIGNSSFQRARNSEYVDKSGLIAVVNQTLNTERSFSCVTRCRRFGKSMAAKMLCAYYDQSCDSRKLFEDLEISQSPSYEQHLNQYPVIYLDITNFTTRDINQTEIVMLIQKEVKEEISFFYPDVITSPDDDLMAVLTKTADHYKVKFIMIIDEWDAICRETNGNSDAMDKYVNLLRRLFKGSNSSQVFAGVYMTGILPIKKYNTQSALNNFTEYTMINPGRMSSFFGFTKAETQMLAAKYGMNFSDLEKWYDGYQMGDEPSIFNPNSVMSALHDNFCQSYWSSTGAFDTVSDYIKMNYKGLKDDVIALLSGSKAKVNTTKFGNDMAAVRNRDDVLTVLIHLGYLSYDRETNECFVPNYEVAGELRKMLSGR